MTEKEREKGKKRTGKLMNSFVVLTIVLSVLAVTMLPASAAAPTVTRTIVPDTPVAPGAVVDVTISFTTEEDLFFLIVEDTVPEGWTVTEIRETPSTAGGAEFNASSHTVEVIWAPPKTPPSGTDVWVNYSLHVPGDATGDTYELDGIVYFFGATGYTVNVTGDCDVTVEAAYGVDLTVNTTEQTVVPGENAIYLLTVRNTGTVTDSYTLTRDPGDADVAVLNRTTIPNLAVGDTADVLLTVRDSTPGDYVVSVTVTSDTHPTTATDSKSTTTHVEEPEYGVDLTVTPDTPQWVAPSEIKTYTLTVTNTGNTEDTFDLTIDDVPADATATLSEGVTPELAPDGTYDIFLNVSSAIENEMGYIVNVTATSQGNPSKSDKVTTKTIVTELIPFTIDFVTGYNMISMPVNNTSVTNASTLIAKIGADCTDVFKWNKTSQGWENYNPSMPPAAAFNIIGGEGYFVSMSGPETVVFTGMGWESPFTISLVTDYNMIGIPVNDTSVTNASLLIDEIGTNCTDVFKWNKTSQGWENYNPSMPPAAAFNIGCGEGYFVSMVGPADVTFVGEPCQD